MITRTDIHDHVCAATAGAGFDDATLAAITDAVLAVAPLETWRLAGLDYRSDALGDEEFWAAVQRVAEGA